MSNHLFEKPYAWYKKHRTRSPIVVYKKALVKYLETVTNKSTQECEDFVVNKVMSRKTDPVAIFYERDPDTGDKEIVKTTLERYILSLITENLNVAPSFTCYTNYREQSSVLVKFTQGRIKQRGVHKKKAIAARTKGNIPVFKTQNLLQQVMKRDNNSVSGLLTVRGSELYDYSAHYTLTSTTRTVTAIGNTTTERFALGARYYSNPDLVIQDIAMTMIYPEHQELKNVIIKHNLTLPTADEVMETVLRSSRKYWANSKEEDRIYYFLSKMSDIDRAVYIYAGDFYHFRQFNPIKCKEILDDISKKYVNYNGTIEDIRNTPDPIINLVTHILLDECRGMGTRYEEFPKELLSVFASTCIGVQKGFNKHKDILDAICCTPHMPINGAYLPDMVREGILLSDTDSTCGTYQDWVAYYNNDEVVFSAETTGLAAAVMTLTTETISHNHKMVSACMGVDDEFKETLAMKNEFTWSLMSPANVSKHYYANTIVQEANVLKEPDLELKGVHLIASKIPQDLTERAHIMMERILRTIGNNEKICLTDEVRSIAELEQEIIRRLKAGDPDFNNYAKIKTPEEYTNNPLSTPYYSQELWMNVFKDKYKMEPTPPYICVKYNTTLTTTTRLNNWVASIEDTTIRRKLKMFLESTNKKTLPTIYLDVGIVANIGVPEEIMSCIDYKKVTLDMCNVFYIILETLGYHKHPDNLISEIY